MSNFVVVTAQIRLYTTKRWGLGQIYLNSSPFLLSYFQHQLRKYQKFVCLFNFLFLVLESSPHSFGKSACLHTYPETAARGI